MRPDAEALLQSLLCGTAGLVRPWCLDVSDLPTPRLDALLADGSLTIQDPSAMLAVEALRPVPGETVLDLCASPGTKTTQILEAIRGEGRVVACDRSPEKLEPLRQLTAARGAKSLTLCLVDDLGRAAPAEGFDAALLGRKKVSGTVFREMVPDTFFPTAGQGRPCHTFLLVSYVGPALECRHGT